MLPLFFVSCHPNGPTPPESTFKVEGQITNVTDMPECDSIYAVSQNDNGEIVIAKAPITNGYFSIQLPATLPESDLHLVKDDFSNLESQFSDAGININNIDITVSDPKAKGAGISFVLMKNGQPASANGEAVAPMEILNANTVNMTAKTCSFMYANQTVDITGVVDVSQDISGIMTLRIIENINLQYKGGWNISQMFEDKPQIDYFNAIFTLYMFVTSIDINQMPPWMYVTSDMMGITSAPETPNVGTSMFVPKKLNFKK